MLALLLVLLLIVGLCWLTFLAITFVLALALAAAGVLVAVGAITLLLALVGAVLNSLRGSATAARQAERSWQPDYHARSH